MPINASYVYRALVLAVHDGDTITARIDEGFYNSTEQRLRIADTYCPELRNVGGPEAQVFTRDLVLGQTVLVETRKSKTARDIESFARFVADVTLPDGRDLGQALVDAGHATRKP